MKLNNHGWGYRMMTLLMTILIGFLLVASYYIYNYYNKISKSSSQQGFFVVERLKWKKYLYYGQ